MRQARVSFEQPQSSTADPEYKKTPAIYDTIASDEPVRKDEPEEEEAPSEEVNLRPLVFAAVAGFMVVVIWWKWHQIKDSLSGSNLPGIPDVIDIE